MDTEFAEKHSAIVEYFRPKIDRGFKSLDEFRPDWAPKINVDELSMDDDCKCIGGQLEGNYGAFLTSMAWTFTDGVDHGFDWPYTAFAAGQGKAVDEVLTAMWRDGIAERVN